MKKFIRTNVVSNKPTITIRDSRFYFNSIFLKLANAADKHYVSYFIDEKAHEIFFDFHKDRVDDNCYSFDAKRKRSSAGEIIKRFNWVKNIHSSNNNKEKMFVSFQRKNIWGIRIRPSFEHNFPIEKIDEIKSDISGIYRYLNDKKEVIYIGKGEVKKRLKETGRDNWGIKTVEFSIIANNKEQYKWEDYWIERYKEENLNDLPIFNRISGVKN